MCAADPVPELPDGVERWSINNLWLRASTRPWLAGWTRWFDLHSTEHIRERKKGTMDCYPWLCHQTKPVYRWAPDPAMKACVVFPDEARQGSRLFCSSLDWMLALAIHERFTEIDLYGFRLTSPNYAFQVGSAQWWIHNAVYHGAQVTIHGRSALKVRVAKSKPPAIAIPPGCLMYGRETTDRSKLYHAP
jgi:hypothetical protein